MGDLGLISGLGIFPGGGHGNSFLHSCLENSHGQRCLEGYSPWGQKELDTAEQYHHRDANQNHRELSPHTPVRMAIINKTSDNRYWHGCGNRENLCTVGGDVNLYSHYGKQHMCSLEHISSEMINIVKLIMISSPHIVSILPWENLKSSKFSVLNAILLTLVIMLQVFQVALGVKNLPANAGDVRDIDLIPEWEDPLEEEMATYSSILAWRIPWTEEPSRLQCMELQRVGYD